MSRFSEKLKLVLSESGTNVYQLSKNSGLERTTIQRTLSGERLPSISFVKKLCSFLRVSPLEEKEILELYNICKIGEKTYMSRRYIKELIERIATIHIRDGNVPDFQKEITVTEQIDEDICTISGQYSVNSLIRSVLEDETANSEAQIIDVSVPFDYGFLYDILYQLYLSNNGKIKIRNILRLSKNPHALDNSNYNLEILSNFLPFAFSAGNGYQPYYYYDNYTAANDVSLIMPFYIITSKRLITLSTDFKTAILYNNENIVDMYKSSFQRAVAQSRPMMTEHFGCDDILLSYIESNINSGLVTHVIEPQPCFAWYYTDELINTHLRQELENRDVILQLLYQFYGSYRNQSYRPMCIFSIEGMQHFISTGIIADLPTQFALPLSAEERIWLLKKLREDIVSGRYSVFAADSSKFIIPNSTIQLHSTTRLDFVSVNNNGIISSSCIEEKSIDEAFYDFFESLPESDLVYTKDETVKIIDSFIKQCSELLQ